MNRKDISPTIEVPSNKQGIFLLRYFLGWHPISVRNGISFITNTAPTVRTCQTSGNSTAFIWSLFIFWCDPIIYSEKNLVSSNFPTSLLNHLFETLHVQTPPPPARNFCVRLVTTKAEGYPLQLVAGGFIGFRTECGGDARCRASPWWKSSRKPRWMGVVGVVPMPRNFEHPYIQQTKRFLDNPSGKPSIFQESKCTKVSLAQIKWTSHNLPQQ